MIQRRRLLSFGLLPIAAIACNHQDGITEFDRRERSSLAAEKENKRWSQYTVRYRPLTLSACVTGDFGTKSTWYLSTNSAGEVEVTMIGVEGESSRRFVVTNRRMRLFREQLISERFFDLDSEYGEMVPDGGTEVISVVVGDISHSVTLHYYMDWVNQNSQAKLREPARALRIMQEIRRWFNDKAAVNLSRYRNAAISVAEGKKKAERRDFPSQRQDRPEAENGRPE